MAPRSNGCLSRFESRQPNRNARFNMKLVSLYSGGRNDRQARDLSLALVDGPAPLSAAAFGRERS
jgi:hypothetical protein